MFICTYAFIYHMYQSKGELHANVKLHFYLFMSTLAHTSTIWACNKYVLNWKVKKKFYTSSAKIGFKDYFLFNN